MVSFLEEQLQCYERSLEEVARDKDVSLERLEEGISVGVALFRTQLAEVQAFNSRRHESHEWMLAEAREYHRRYERISALLDRLHLLAEAMHDRGLPVRGLEKLAAARFALGPILRVTPDRLERSYQDIKAGRLIPLETIRGELQRRLRA